MSAAISIVAAVHELRELRATDLADAVEEMKNMLASGRIAATATIDGKRQRIDPRRWWFASLRLPLAEATLTVFDPPGTGTGTVQRAAEITIEGMRAIDPATAPDPGRVRKIVQRK